MMKEMYIRYWLLLLILIVCNKLSANNVEFVAGTDVSSTMSITKDGITVSVSEGTFSRTDNYRHYASSTTTVSSTVGNITKVVFTCTADGTAKYGPAGFTKGSVSTGSYSFSGKDGSWSGNTSEFSIKASSQVRIHQNSGYLYAIGNNKNQISYIMVMILMK